MAEEFATKDPSLENIVKGGKLIAAHVMAKDYDSPIVVDWGIELPQQAHLLLRDHEIPDRNTFAVGPGETVEDMASRLHSCCEELEREHAKHTQPLAAGVDAPQFNPAIISLIIKAVMYSRQIIDMLPPSIRDRIYKFLPFLGG